MDQNGAPAIAAVDDVRPAKGPGHVLPLTPSVLMRHNASFLPTTPSGQSVSSSVVEDPERLRHHLTTLAQEKSQLIRSLEQVVGMYGELKTQYTQLHASHERLQAEHEAIVRSATAPLDDEASPAGSGAVGDEEAELTEEEKLLLQVKELKRQLQVSINSKISATKHGQLERHAMEADKERLQGDLRRMQQRIEAQDAALETLQNERKALLHYAQTLEGDAARMRVAAEESGALKSSSQQLQAQLRQAAGQIEELKEVLYKTQHELEWRTSAPGDDPHDYETFAMKAEQELHLTKMKLMKATCVARHVHAAKAAKAEDDLRRVTTLWWEMATLVGVDLKRLHPDINPKAHEAVLAKSDGGDLAKVLFRKVKHRLSPFLEAIQAHGTAAGAEHGPSGGPSGPLTLTSGAAAAESSAQATSEAASGSGTGGGGGAGAGAGGGGGEAGDGGGEGGDGVDSGDESESEVARRQLVSRLASTFVTVVIRSSVNNLVSGDRSIGTRA